MKKYCFKRETGVSLIHFTIALLPLLAIGGFAIDFGNSLVSQTELQNAADAGALEGARQLYGIDGKINPNTGKCFEPPCGSTCLTDPACSTAASNNSNGSAIEVISSKRGHWEFKEAGYADSNGIERGGLFHPNSNKDTAELIKTAVSESNVFKFFRPLVDLSLDGPAVPNCDGENKNSNLDTDINRDTCNINSVEVCVKSTTKFHLASLIGFSELENTACSVAYIGFAGSINPGEVDAPIAMCMDKMLDQNNKYSCRIGRYSTSSETSNPETILWTDLTQPTGSCSSPGNLSGMVKNDMKVCNASSTWSSPKLVLGRLMSTTNGKQDNSITDLYNCWRENASLYADGEADTAIGPNKPLELKIPVVNCEDYSPGDCKPLVGATTVRVLWIVDLASKMTEDGSKKESTIGVPTKMTGVPPFADWYGTIDGTEKGTLIANPVERWNSFINHFEIKDNAGGAAAICPDLEKPNKCESYKSSTIYFAPDCNSVPMGGTGGPNFGILAEVPVLVR